MDYKLILFDIDGTIADRDSVEIYPAARRFIEALDPSVHVALVTNQGGPACHDAGWPWSDQFPTFKQVEIRLAKILIALPMRPFVRGATNVYGMFVCYAYQQKDGNVILPKAKLRSSRYQSFFVFSGLAYRKPQPGMILKAMKEYRVAPADVLMIGDRPEDADAARAAGVAFRHADDI